MEKGTELELEEARLSVRKPTARGRALVLSQVLEPGQNRFAGVINGPLLVGQRRKIRELRFHLINFHSYIGNPVRFGSRDSPTFSKGRLQLASKRWIVTIDQQPDADKLLKKVKEFGGYAITHVCSIRRRDGLRLSYADADELTSACHFFFGLCRGGWAGPVIPFGAGARSPIWTEWSSWRLTPWHSASSWFPKFDPTGLGTAFGGFMDLWDSPLWNEPLRHAIHWYVEANQNSGALEGATVFAQAALELLAWVTLVEDGRIITAAGFENLPAADKFRLLLNEFSVPSAIPVEFNELAEVAKSNSIPDGPGALTGFRNAIIHPKQGKRAFLRGTKSLAKFQVLQLAITYVELMLLAKLGYEGKYLRRWIRGTEAEAIAPVPWAARPVNSRGHG